jgi:hypothetical protein
VTTDETRDEIRDELSACEARLDQSRAALLEITLHDSHADAVALVELGRELEELDHTLQRVRAE